MNTSRLSAVAVAALASSSAFANPVPGFLPAPTDGVQLGSASGDLAWDFTEVRNNGVTLDNAFVGATWSTFANTTLGAGFTYVLNSDVSVNDGDIIQAGSFIYYRPNPILNYSFAVRDNGAPSAFNFTLSSAIAPGAVGPHNVRVDFGSVLSDGADADSTVIFTALAPPVGIPVDSDGLTEAQVLTFRRVIDAPTTRINAGYDLGATAAITTFGLVQEGPILAERNFAFAWDLWQFDLNFHGSGGGDAYAINGRAEATLIPVPAAFWLLGSALGAGFSLVRRRA